MKITTGKVETHRDIAAESDFMNVPWQITEGETVLLEGAQAFPLTATELDVREFLERKMKTYQENCALHEGAKELQAGLDNSAMVAGQITNLSIEK